MAKVISQLPSGGSVPKHNNLLGLNEGDYLHLTQFEKAKLDGIQSGAEVNVNADWNAISGDAQILNKPVSFPPSTHTHTISEVINLQNELNSKENISNKVNTISGNSSTEYPTEKAVVDYVSSQIGADFAKVVYFDNVTPNVASIFDLNNPPLVNDPSLKEDVANLYIGTDASTWVYITSPAGYVTKTVTSSGSNFYITGTSTDAGSIKTGSITKKGQIVIDSEVVNDSGLTLKKTESSILKTDSLGKVVKATNLQDVEYAPIVHTHTVSQITDFAHTHPISDVTGLPTALDDLQLNKEDKSNKNIANGYAGLDSSGKINPIQLPALAITDTFVVNSQAEQLTLVAEVGDVAVRTDLNKSFILRVTGASTLANWQELLSPTSVDQTIIDGSTNAVSGNAVFDALATKAPISSVHNPVTIGTANGLSLSNQQLSLGLASSSTTGALSDTDWNTFNNKENAFSKNTAFNKNFGLNSGDVVGANTLLNQYSTTPIEWTATAFNSGQVVFFAGKQWISKIATVAGDVPAASSKWEEITFDALANKTVTVDQTIIDGSTNAVSGNAVFDGLALKSNLGHTHAASQITDLSKASVGLGNVDNTSDLSKPLSTATINALATKAPISSVHNPVTLGTANGLSLSTQQLSLGLASSGVTGALSGTDWNNFNSKFNTPTGLTTNYLPKWNGSGFGNSTWQEFAGGRLSNTGNDDLTNQLQVNGSGFFNSNLNIKGSFTSVDTGLAFGNTAFRIEGFSNPTSSVYETRISFSPWNYNGSSFAFREALSLNSNLTATFSSSVTATSFIKSGGTSSQFLKADGSSDSSVYAPLASPTLTGTPTAPTAPAGTNTTQIATTAFVQAMTRSGSYTVTDISTFKNMFVTYTIVGKILILTITGTCDFPSSGSGTGGFALPAGITVSTTGQAINKIVATSICDLTNNKTSIRINSSPNANSLALSYRGVSAQTAESFAMTCQILIN